jgi:hypothetical protein
VRQSPTTDVALVRLDTAITDIAPIEVRRSAPEVGDVVRLAGYGSTDGDASKTADRLKTNEFTVTSVADDYVGMTGKAPRRTTSPCPHDSGGPYVAQGADGRPELVSVVSRGPLCPHSGVDLSGRVDPVADWIRDITGPASTAPSAPPPEQAAPSEVPPGQTRAWPQGPSDQARAGVALTSIAIPVGGVAVALLLAVTTIRTSIVRRRRDRAYRRRGLRRHRRT